MSANGPATPKTTAIHVVLVIVLGFLVYSNTLGSPFSFDDTVFLRSELYRDITNIPSIFINLVGEWSSRPLLHATMAVNYYLDGLNTRGYHAANIALHLANGVLLYFLVLLTGKQLGHSESSSRLTALFSAVIFTLHPLQTEAVTNIIGRSMLMVTAFYLSGLIIFLKAAASGGRRWHYGAALFAVALLGSASREDFITFPLMLALYDLFFIARFRTKELLGRWKLYLPVVIACGYLPYLATHHTYDKVWSYGKGIPPLHYALTQLNVHSTYLRLLLLPVNQNIDYSYPTAQTFMDSRTVFSALAYAGLWAGVALLARKRPAAAFGGLWFMVALLPISFIVPAVSAAGLLKVSLGDVIFEHRGYLPSAGIVVFGVASLVRMRGTSPAGRVAVPLLVALALSLGVAAYARNAVWSDGIRLWKDSISKSPGNARGYNNVATYYWKLGQKDDALKYLETALRLDPRVADSHYNVGLIYASEGRLDEAIGHYLESIALEPASPKTHYELANAYVAKGLLSDAIEHYKLEIRISPKFINAYVNLGIAYNKAGMPEKAAEQYEKALLIEPDNADAHYNLANSYMRQGRVEEAITHYEKSIALRPDDPAVHNNLAIAYRANGLNGKAQEHMGIAEMLRKRGGAK